MLDLQYCQRKSPLLTSCNFNFTRSEKCPLVFAQLLFSGCDTFIIHTPRKPSTLAIEKMKCLQRTGGQICQSQLFIQSLSHSDAFPAVNLSIYSSVGYILLLSQLFLHLFVDMSNSLFIRSNICSLVMYLSMHSIIYSFRSLSTQSIFCSYAARKVQLRCCSSKVTTAL